MASQAFTAARLPSTIGRQAEALLNRYPALSAAELETLIEIFPKLPILDAGLMAGEDRLSRKVAAFHEAHGAKLKTPRATLIVFILGFLVLPATIALLWWMLPPV